MKYTWNRDKAEAVRLTHGIRFGALIDVFKDPYALEYVDEEHSTPTERRYQIIGLAGPGLIFLVYTEPAPDVIHFITARHAEPWMVREYERNRKRY
jgi:hypothetical protein